MPNVVLAHEPFIRLGFFFGVLLSVAWHAGESTDAHDEIPVSDAVPSTM